ncbi:hypothetical protein SCOR_17435 [Sulfidibacter corallicola]|uniref:Outer membrane protein beta-barrel domain-containing protein n=1 Tax=Sulfidibacter corallicola TaxID=2818388 RepID=A0A8A4TW90_SULCO|nr:porin family protein [Sulfidibacter corallicola]QTD53760.1 hypothetical protein J3U87_15020 [Sulfidibacter corallicola]
MTGFRFIIVLLFSLPALAWGDTTFQEQSGRLQAINAYLLDFRPAGAPTKPDKRALELVLDLYPQPSIDTRVGRKDEPIDPPNLVPKFRGRYLLASGLHLGAAYAPGIEFQDYEAEFISLELGYRFTLAKTHFALRASYSDGDVEGPVTEPDVTDLFDFQNQGVDLSVGRIWKDFEYYGFLGVNDIETRLDVEVDGAILRHEEDTYYGGLGVTWRRGALFVNLEQNATDDFLRNLVLSVGYRF